MTDERIMQLPVERLAADVCALFLWSTAAKLKVAIKTMRHWGFTYKCVFLVWVKEVPGSDQSTSGCEFCLLGVRGAVSKLRCSAKIRQMLKAPETGDGRKPEAAHRRIEQYFHKKTAKSAVVRSSVRKMHIFCQNDVPGWYSWNPELCEDVSVLQQDARRVRAHTESLQAGASVHKHEEAGASGEDELARCSH
jgi:N6-adenosine-specific RNA methylase IME4